MRLAVYDMSAYVHTGMSVSKYAEETVRGFPVGGIVYFLRSLCMHLSNQNHVVACFDSRCDKKDLLPGYKSGRPRNNLVSAQLEFLYAMLPSFGIPCLKVEGFEADELIYTAVEHHRQKFMRVTTFSSDYDITHNVNNNVDFEPVNAKANKVNYSNFRDAVVPTHKLMLNTVSAYKAIFGDSSDEIPVFQSAVSNESLYKGYCDFLMAAVPAGSYPSIDWTRDVKTFAAYVHTRAGELGADATKLLITRAFVTHPRFVANLEVPVASIHEVDKTKLARFLSCMRDNSSLRTLRLQYTEMTKEEEQIFFDLSSKLRTGEFAVDRNKSVHNMQSGSQDLFMREFDL